jgi:hypothetical protein
MARSTGRFLRLRQPRNFDGNRYRTFRKRHYPDIGKGAGRLQSVLASGVPVAKQKALPDGRWQAAS